MATSDAQMPTPPWAADESGRAELRAGTRRAIENPVTALAHAAALHLDGQSALARALADLTVSGCSAWRTFVTHHPKDTAVHLALDALEPDVAHGDVAASAIDAVLGRAYATAWRLRHGAVSDRTDWIAECRELDSPYRHQHRSAQHAQHDVTLTPSTPPSDRSVHTRWSVLDDSNNPWPVDAADRAIDRILPPARRPYLDDETDILIHLAWSPLGIEEAEHLVGAASKAGVTLLAIDAPGGGTAHHCDDPTAVLRPWASLADDVIDALGARLDRDLRPQVIAVGDARSLLVDGAAGPPPSLIHLPRAPDDGSALDRRARPRHLIAQDVELPELDPQD